LKYTHSRISAATAILLVLALAQVYVVVGFADAKSERESTATPAQIMGVLTTSDGKAITVNGAAAVSGATVPSGATLETPAGVGATLRLGPLGSLCIAPGSQVTVEFDQQGNAGTIRVTVNAGCVILNTKKNTTGTVITPQGTAGQIGPGSDGAIDVCLRPGAAAAINVGAAFDAGAGASRLDCSDAAGAAAAEPTGIPVAAVIPMIAGGGAGFFFLFRGGNPSESNP
jgi:hypothetical protein